MEAWIVAATLGPLASLGVLLGILALRRRPQPQPAAATSPAPSAPPAGPTVIPEPSPESTPEAPPAADPAAIDPCQPSNMPTGGSVLEMDDSALQWFRQFGGTSRGTRWSPTGEINITVEELAAELCRSDADRDRVAAQAERVGAVRTSVQRVIRQDGETAARGQQSEEEIGEVNLFVDQMRRGPTATATPSTQVAEAPAAEDTNGDVPPPHTPVTLR